MKLSDRLAKIAEIIPDGAYVADIGTDHGYLPIYLAETEKARHVVLCDVNAGPLEKAALNIAEAAKGEGSLRALEKPHSLMPKVAERTLLSKITGKKHFKIEQPESEWDLRRGDGLSPLETGEADVCVIAGMGGYLIRDILTADPEKTASVKLFILQPRTEEGMLRAWLRETGWGFYRDCLVREGTFLCQIIAVVPPENAADVKTIQEQDAEEREEIRKMREGVRAPWDTAPDLSDVIGEPAPEKMSPVEELTHLCGKLGWEISPLWVTEDDPLVLEYLQRKIVKEEGILDALKGAKSAESAAKTGVVMNETDALKRLVQIVNDGSCKNA